MQNISKEKKNKLIKDSIPESQKKPVPGLLDRPLRPLRRPALPKSRRERDKQKQNQGVRKRRKVFRKQKGYRRRKKQKFKLEPIVLSLPKRGFFPVIEEKGTKIRDVKEPMPKGLLDYKNLPLLRQYLNVQGKIIRKKKTRLTTKEQRKVAYAIKTARTLAFLPFIRR
uniref:Small ribosomal subunit protein bS18c n=1 Tax=Blidingia minima TaxID=63414 RepID=A0A8E5N7U4_9CHLO|nr:30S ribosomal protein S18 [Blidingia minima]